MAEWKVPDGREQSFLREKGLDPDGFVVNRAGVDIAVFLELKTGREIVAAGYRESGRGLFDKD